VKSHARVPILEALNRYQTAETSAFHTPGHKQGKGFSWEYKDILQENLFSYDLTEVLGLDDLHNPTGAIKEAQGLAANLFKAEETFFLVNGTSSGLQATIMALFGPKDEIIVPRNIHHSVFTGLIYSGAIPRFIYPHYETRFGITLGITLKQVKQAIKDYPQAKGILLIHPSYYGISSEFEAIVQYAKARNKIVIVDEAHGAHFMFSHQLPLSAMEAGADVAVQSSHKTLSSLTQSSLLHVRDYSGPFKTIKDALRLVQTSSPSYLLLASLDIMRHQFANYGDKLVEETLETARKIRRELEAVDDITLLQEKDLLGVGNFQLDPTKILINVATLGITGHEAEKVLREDFNVQVELSDLRNVLALITVGDGFETGQKFIAGIKGLVKKYERNANIGLSLDKSDEKTRVAGLKLEQHMTPRDAWFGVKESIKIGQAEGRILGEEIVPYPPGIPLAIPGEVITDELIRLLENMRESRTKLQGVQDASLHYLRVIKD